MLNKILPRIRKEFYEILQMLFAGIPGTIGKYGRMFFYKLYLKKQGRHFSTGIRIRIQTPKSLILGNNVGINDNVWIAANKNPNGQIIIKDDVLIGPYTIIHSGNHNFDSLTLPISQQGYKFSTITIENGVWIAARCTILAGVTIGEGALIAAGSVITKSIPPYSIVAGVPGKIIGDRRNLKNKSI